ncbi:gene ii and x protein [Ralstonia solanacearum]|nr:gene ii and x protein [Ralstonia solanacearum]
MSIEENYNISFIASLALREKQIQQNYRPIIAVHKWFARRPGTLFRGLLLSEFGSKPVERSYYDSNRFNDRTVADPFMGGGTPLLEANRLGCDVVGMDINPMSAWVVREEIDALDLGAYAKATDRLAKHLEKAIGDLYKTRCPITGRMDADVKYFLWVKTGACSACGKDFDLFPGYTLAEDSRHPAYVLVCQSCGDLNEVVDPKNPGKCGCGEQLKTEGPVKRNRCTCPHCGHVNTAPFHREGRPTHRLFAMEYYNPDLKDRPGRLFKKPDAEDLARVEAAAATWKRMRPSFVPDDFIPEGDESSRLHRWGYERFRELFNPRQLLALENSARYIAGVKDQRVRRALATNFSDLLRYQNMLCRYDTMALKSLDVFSIHGFPVGYIQVESNFLGIRNGGGKPVGSGGWVNITEKYAKAKRYCTDPFEVMFNGKKKATHYIAGEWIGEKHPQRPDEPTRAVDIHCVSSTEAQLAPRSLDAVFTDPPYFGMVQYGELMQFCYVWLRKLMGEEFPGLEPETTRHADELTGNETAERDIEHFAEGLAAVYKRMAAALKPGAPLVFTYHHNKQEAYLAAAMGILDAGLTCSASLPCPAEMGGSIHIHGTGSSIVDTVFVCRDGGVAPRHTLVENATQLAVLMSKELAELVAAGMKPTPGDIRCIAFGHIARMAIWRLRSDWDASRPTAEKLEAIRKSMDSIATVDELRAALGGAQSVSSTGTHRKNKENQEHVHAAAI